MADAALAPRGWRLVGPLILCALVMMADGYDLTAMALAVPHITRDWGTPPQSFAFTLSAAVLGLGIGALLIGPLGDRKGRRPVVLVSTLAMAFATAGTATAASLGQLVLWRILTGAALGVCLPNMTSLAAELAPRARRASVLTIVSCGVSIGATAAGLLAPTLVDLGGWHALFTLPAAAMLLLTLLLFVSLPESPEFLEAKGRAVPAASRRLPILAPLAAEYRFATFVFAGLFLLNALALYMLTQWLPTILPRAGFSIAQAARMTGIVQAGGLVGALILAVFLDRSRAVAALMAGYLLVAACLIAFSFTPAHPLAWSLLLFIVGGGIAGAHLALMAVGTTFYPASVLSSAIGIAVAVARIGAFAGPFIGGIAVGAGMGPQSFFLIVLVPVLLLAAAVTAIPAAQRRNQAPAVASAGAFA